MYTRKWKKKLATISPCCILVIEFLAPFLQIILALEKRQQRESARETHPSNGLITVATIPDIVIGIFT